MSIGLELQPESLIQDPQVAVLTADDRLGRAVSLAILFRLARWVPRLPAAPTILIAAGAAVALFGLDRYGIAILGVIPAGVPPLRLPRFPEDDIPSLLGSAAGLALVLFSSGMLTARSFGRGLPLAPRPDPGERC